MRRLTAVLMGVVAGTLVSCSPAVAASGWTGYVVNYEGSTAYLTPFNTATDAKGTAISVSDGSGYVAVPPDGKTAYVTDYNGYLIPVDLATGTAKTPIDLGVGEVDGVAIAPDGQTAYVTSATGYVVPVNLATDAVGAAIAVAGQPNGIAIAPDGLMAYVVDYDGNSVTPIDLETDTAGTAIPAGDNPQAIAVTPNGDTAYVADNTGNTVIPIDLADGTAETAISAGSGYLEQIAMAPNGQTAYVTDYGGDVTPIDTQDNKAGAPIDVGTSLDDIAITPDGRTAYVDAFNNGDVYAVNLSTGNVGSPATFGTQPLGIAITPDQAPVAAFTATAARPGAATAFDGSGSSSAVGSIASYAWSFGDGTSVVTTTTPTTSHIYAKPGTYTVRLTVTNTAGTSTSQVFTGQTMSQNGGPSATMTHTVKILPPPPVLTRVKQSHRTWREGKVKVGHGKKPPPKGTTFSFTLSTAATVSLAFSGPKLHGRPQTATLTTKGKAGVDRLSFDGRIRGHGKLRPGRWHVTLTARGTGGSSTPAKLSFTIVG